MRPSEPFALSVLCCLLASSLAAPSPAYAEDSPSQGSAEEQSPARTETAPCPFDTSGNGQLRRASGSIEGASMSNGWESVELMLGGEPLLSFSQEDPIKPGGGNHVEHPLEIRCEPGLAKIQVPGAGAIALAFSEGRFRFAPAWLAGLQRFLDAVRPEGWPLLFQLLGQLEDIDPVPRHRARLQWAELSIRSGDWAQAAYLLEGWSSRSPASLAARDRELSTRLARLRSRKPILTAYARSVAPLAALPAMPPQARPTVFWKGVRLCVAQEGAAPATMRCHDPERERWSDPEPLVDPVAASAARWSSQHCGRSCLNQTEWSFSRDGAKPTSVGYLDPADLVAYLPDGRLLAFELSRDAKAFKLLAGTPAGSQTASGPELARLLAQAPGTRVAARGRYLLTGRYVVDTSQPKRSWLLFSKALGRDSWGDWQCSDQSDPLVSPDARWGACVAKLVQPTTTAGKKTPPPFSLWVFRLAEQR